MLLVKDVMGPATVTTDTTATYRVTRFNQAKPSARQRKQINWQVRAGDQTIAEFQNHGPVLELEIESSMSGHTLTVMPYMNAPSQVVSTTTRVEDTDPGTPAPARAKLSVLSRDQWGARTDLPRKGARVAAARRTEVFIHHTVIVDSDDTPNEWDSLAKVKKQMRRLQTIREADLGADVPYSMVAFCMKNGSLILGEGRGLKRSGAHTRGHNTTALGISLQGNFENAPLPQHFDAQLGLLGNWLRTLRTEQGFLHLGSSRPQGREVFGHRDVKATACPGGLLYDRLDKIRFL